MRVFLVSPLPAVRAGLRALVSDLAGAEIAGEAAGVEALAPDSRGVLGGADVVVIDVPAEATASDLAPLAAEGEAAPIILGPVAGEEGLAGLLRGRAWAYLPRDASGEALVAAVAAVAAGLTVVEPGLAERLQGAAAGDLGTAHGRTGGGGDGPIEALTPREREVLQLVAAGLPNKQIARRLAVSDHTVKFHVAAVLAKLGAASRTEAVNVGLRRGLVAL